MVKKTTVLLGLVLVLFVSGCSTLQVAKFPVGQGEVELPEDSTPTVEPGNRVKITGRLGESIEGEVQSVNRASITIYRIGNYGAEELEFQSSEIEKVEIIQPDNFWKGFAWFGVGLIVLIYYGLVNSSF